MNEVIACYDEGTGLVLLDWLTEDWFDDPADFTALIERHFEDRIYFLFSVYKGVS